MTEDEAETARVFIAEAGLARRRGDLDVAYKQYHRVLGSLPDPLLSVEYHRPAVRRALLAASLPPDARAVAAEAFDGLSATMREIAGRSGDESADGQRESADLWATVADALRNPPPTPAAGFTASCRIVLTATLPSEPGGPVTVAVRVAEPTGPDVLTNLTDPTRRPAAVGSPDPLAARE